MGAVPERAPVGHRARGLQPARQCLGLLSARPRAQPRLSLGRGRHRRILRRSASGCACRSRCGTNAIPILKERLFGLTNGEGNHGEDVKELYYYLDATPTHSYLKMLYKYPQAHFPTRIWSRRTGAAASSAPEFELLDTGVFDDDRYFDVFVEYAQAGAERRSDARHGRTIAAPRAAPLHVLPQLWFRNTWSWKPNRLKPHAARRGRRRHRCAEHSAPRQLSSATRERRYRELAVLATTRPTPGVSTAAATRRVLQGCLSRVCGRRPTQTR